MNCVKVVLNCFDGIFFVGSLRVILVPGTCVFRVLYTRIYKTNVVTLRYFFRTMMVAYVVFIDYIAMF